MIDSSATKKVDKRFNNGEVYLLLRLLNEELGQMTQGFNDLMTYKQCYGAII